VSRRPDATVHYLTPQMSGPLGDILAHYWPHRNGAAIVASGGVWLGTCRLYDPSYGVAAGTTLKIYCCPNQGYRYAFSPNFILHETDDWVVVYKEPLITVGMDRSNMFFNLMAGLNDFYGFNDMSAGVQPITRLDYRVGGLCLFSKKKASERRLFSQMQQRRIKKRYMAVVPASDALPVSRCTVKNRLEHRRKAYESPEGKWAHTRFIYANTVDHYRRYYAVTKTGRRHQVRFHASQSIGALVNDELYAKPYRDRHAPIGLIATHLFFIWKGERIRMALPSHYIDWTIDWLKKGG